MASLPTWVAGAIRPSLSITWTTRTDSDSDGTAFNLFGATLTGRVLDTQTGQARDIAGTLTVTDGPAGVFRWEFAAADVVSGTYEVQFTATYPDAPTPARSYSVTWTVEREL